MLRVDSDGQEDDREVGMQDVNRRKDIILRADDIRIQPDRAYTDTVPDTLGVRHSSFVGGTTPARSRETSTSGMLSSKPKPPDSFTLFASRSPRNSLPSRPSAPAQSTRTRMRASVFASSSPAYQSSSNVTHPASASKRRESVDVTPAIVAQKPMRAITTMQSMFSVVEKQSVTAAGKEEGRENEKDQELTPSSAPAVGANQFARQPHEVAKVSLSTVLKRLQPLVSVSAPALVIDQARRTAERRPPPLLESRPSTKLQEHARRSNMNKRPASPPSAGGLATAGSVGSRNLVLPRPAKKLRPITSLPVPEWPGKPTKPLSEHRKKLQFPSPKLEKQIPLPPAIEKMQPRVSAPKRLRLAPARSKEGVNNGTGKLVLLPISFISDGT